MFDIAWSELFVILVVALVVVGPKDLPKLMRKAGQWAGRARTMADQFRRSFDDMARQSELDELRNQVSKLKDVAQKPMTDLNYQAHGIVDEVKSIKNDMGNVAPPKLDAPAPAPGATPQHTSNNV